MVGSARRHVASLDGLTVCRELRAASDVPIVLLTARGSESDRVLGLELQGDDYIVKPFSVRELVARIRTILRRTERADQRSASHPLQPSRSVDSDSMPTVAKQPGTIGPLLSLACSSILCRYWPVTRVWCFLGPNCSKTYGARTSRMIYGRWTP